MPDDAFPIFANDAIGGPGIRVGRLTRASWEHSTALAQRDNAAPPNPQADLQRLNLINTDPVATWPQ
jgi:hypothetical protein